MPCYSRHRRPLPHLLLSDFYHLVLSSRHQGARSLIQVLSSPRSWATLDVSQSRQLKSTPKVGTKSQQSVHSTMTTKVLPPEIALKIAGFLHAELIQERCVVPCSSLCRSSAEPFGSSSDDEVLIRQTGLACSLVCRDWLVLGRAILHLSMRVMLVSDWHEGKYTRADAWRVRDANELGDRLARADETGRALRAHDMAYGRSHRRLHQSGIWSAARDA